MPIKYLLTRWPDITVVRIVITDEDARVSYQCVTPDREANIISADSYKDVLAASAHMFLMEEHPGWRENFPKCVFACYMNELKEVVCELTMTILQIESFKYVLQDE